MNERLGRTLDLLTTTSNEAAVAVLLAGLDAPGAAIQEEALSALLARRRSSGQRELIRRWGRLSERWKWKIAQHPRQISAAVRHAVLSQDAALCANGCDAVLRIREYELIPALVTATLESGDAQSNLVAETLVKMAEMLYEELAGPRDRCRRQDPSAVCEQVLPSLRQAVDRFDQHKRREVVEAFLLLASRSDSVLKKILGQPRHPAYLVVLDVLGNTSRLGIIRLLLGYLEDRAAPSVALQVTAHRSDVPFVRQWLRRLRPDALPRMRANLRRMESITWLGGELELLESLTEDEQRAAVELAASSGMKRLMVFEVVKRLLLRGAPAGRRAAAEAMAEFGGAEANQLVVDGLADPDPEVQARLVKQLRPRGIPGAITRIMQAVDSPHEAVRQAARASLGEFNLKRYLSAFDIMDDETRRHTGRLVVQIDRDAATALAEELKSPTRTRRLRALEAADAMQIVPQVEALVIGLLGDDDHFVRAEAARVLAAGRSPLSRQALWKATADANAAVRDAAEQALEQWSRATEATRPGRATEVMVRPPPSGAPDAPTGAPPSSTDRH